MYRHYPTLLVSPKQGGILQSSGFLDLMSLMSLSQTCKANALDELSLILLIENDLTLCHKVETMEEAIAFLKEVYRKSPEVKRWLNRESFEKVTLNVEYDVMLAKLLRVEPDSEHFRIVRQTDRREMNLLHHAAERGNFESVKVILDLLPESKRVQLLGTTYGRGRSLFDDAVRSKDIECVEYLLGIYPESERLKILKDRRLLHVAADSGDVEWIRTILEFYPKSERQDVIRMQDSYGRTVLGRSVDSGSPEAIQFVLSLYPEPERFKVVSKQNQNGGTLLHDAAGSNHVRLFIIPTTTTKWTAVKHRPSTMS